MRQRLTVTVGLVVFLLVLMALPAVAWGPAGHAAVGLGVAQLRQVSFNTNYLALQALYGTAVPDLAWQAGGALQSELDLATHETPGYRKPWNLARRYSMVQQAFALGWLTHNQVWGADFYAHGADPFSPPRLVAGPGYVTDRAALLAAEGVPSAVAHEYVEVAIDLLLDQEHPELQLASLLGNAAWYRDSQVPLLLSRSYANVPGSSSLTIIRLEGQFRIALSVYASTLSQPIGSDDAIFAAGMAVAYGLPFEDSAAALSAAKQLCRDPEANYWDALVAAVERVSAAPWPQEAISSRSGADRMFR